MQKKDLHLTYCTNIHPGESWEETYANLQKYIPSIKKEVSPADAFGIGLRLSDKASKTLTEKNNLPDFKNWLAENNCYVFTLNGFPFGGFHHQAVKDLVHQPDWTTQDRLDYTARLFDILSELLPAGMDGGISTSPLSYRYWEAAQTKKEDVLQKATLNMVKIAEKLYRINQEHNQVLHLDIEPEPDGLIENTREFIDWYQNWLIPIGAKYLKEKANLSSEEAEACLKNHIRICYDVCHFAIVYEKPEEVFQALSEEGIIVGKIQISAALKARLPETAAERTWVSDALAPFVESTYLHQVVARNSQDQLTHYPDLPQALKNLTIPEAKEWRTHFHVPVFMADYGRLESTQEDILEVLKYLKTNKVTHHLEVETYTWEVLPADIQLEIVDSIVRELKWVDERL